MQRLDETVEQQCILLDELTHLLDMEATIDYCLEHSEEVVTDFDFCTTLHANAKGKCAQAQLRTAESLFSEIVETIMGPGSLDVCSPSCQRDVDFIVSHCNGTIALYYNVRCEEHE